MGELPESAESQFNHMLQKLVDFKHITSFSADEAKHEFSNFLNQIVRENKVIIREYDIDAN